MVEQTEATASSAAAAEAVDTAAGAVQPTETKVATTDAPVANKPAPGDAKPADSSTAKGAKEAPSKKVLLDVLKDVRNEATKGKGKSPTPEKTGTEAKPEPEVPADKPVAEVKDEDLPFHNHPRFKQLIRERNDFEADATQHRKVLSYMEQNNLAAPEVQEGFQVMSLLKRDPAKAREALMTWVNRIDEVLGNTISPDLKAKIETGAIDEETAKEVAKTRANATNATRVAEEARKAVEETNFRNHVAACAGAVTKWENGLKAKDPDFAVKQPFLVKAIKLRMADERRAPRDTAEAVSWAADALKEVEADLAPTLRNRGATKPTASTAAVRTEAPQPKSVLEAVMFADRKGKRAA